MLRLTLSSRYLLKSSMSLCKSQASPPTTSDEVVTVEDYRALLRHILPYQAEALHGFLEAMQSERRHLERLNTEFDEKVKKMESLRDEMRMIVMNGEQESIKRRDEIVAALKK